MRLHLKEQECAVMFIGRDGRNPNLVVDVEDDLDAAVAVLQSEDTSTVLASLVGWHAFVSGSGASTERLSLLSRDVVLLRDALLIVAAASAGIEGFRDNLLKCPALFSIFFAVNHPPYICPASLYSFFLSP